MRGVLSAVVVGTIAIGGCASTVRIKKAPTADALKTSEVKGVPFYIKVAKCKQETSWRQPVYSLTLKRTTTYQFVDEKAAKAANPNAKPPDTTVHTVTKTLSLSQFNGDEVRDLRKSLSESADAGVIDVRWKAVAGLQDYVAVNEDEDTLISSKNVFLTSNTATPEAVTDYGTTYYYNAPRPWVGTSQIDAKLATDGTLSEGSAQVQSQTLSTILSALPISTLLTKAAGAAAADAQHPDATKATTQYELTITEAGYTHIHSRYQPYTLPCAVEPNGVRTDYALTIQNSGQDASKKDDGDTVKFDGSVVLPKPAAAAK